jgi:hypothetical protein
MIALPARAHPIPHALYLKPVFRLFAAIVAAAGIILDQGPQLPGRFGMLWATYRLSTSQTQSSVSSTS